MTDRIHLDDLTSDQLDELYTRLEQAEAAAGRLGPRTEVDTPACECGCGQRAELVHGRYLAVPACEQNVTDGVTVRPEEYTVTAVPDDASPDAHLWALTVRHRGDDRWAIQRGEHACLGTDGTWAQGVKEYDRGTTWLDEHRFDLEAALQLARQAAPHVTVNGITVADVLARRQGEAQR